jgi:type IV pilus assembly protein PilQ
MMKKNIIFILLVFTALIGYSQTRVDSVKTNLEKLAKTYPKLNEEVSISVSDVSIQEFIRGVAKSSKVNINVSPDIDFMVVNNFSDVKVIDMLVFLAKQYDLDIDITGNIISISKHIFPEKKPGPIKPKELKVFYQTKDSLLSLDLRNDSLYKVAKVITEKTGQNIILAPGVENKKINSFVKDKPFDQTIEMLAYANNLKANKNSDGFYILEAKIQEKKSSRTSRETNKSGRQKGRSKASNKKDSDLEPELHINVSGLDDISVYAVNTPIYDILKSISDQLSVSYYFLSDIEDNANLNVTNITYDQLLNHLFDGTEYIASNQKGVYLFGEKKTNELLKTKVLQLQYRTVEKVTEIIPDNLKQDLSINEFLDLNSLIITGPETQISDLEMFVREIDKVVPVVLIEVMIVDVQRNFTQNMGIEAGLNRSKVATSTTGELSTGQINFSTSTLNNLINSFNGFGWFSIGKVTPDFYFSIKALEQNGNIKIRSTPMLSTLNGSEASLTIGETQYYYQEERTTMGTQNPQHIKTGTWNPVNADLTITIKPVVSGDEQVTLDIEVSQSDFTGKVAVEAPPGTVDRTFKSYIRIKNQEMVLLGGLENKKKSDAGSGLPFLARVPVIKWFFGSRTKTNNYSKLNIFIKPTVIY